MLLPDATNFSNFCQNGQIKQFLTLFQQNFQKHFVNTEMRNGRFFFSFSMVRNCPAFRKDIAIVILYSTMDFYSVASLLSDHDFFNKLKITAISSFINGISWLKNLAYSFVQKFMVYCCFLLHSLLKNHQYHSGSHLSRRFSGRNLSCLGSHQTKLTVSEIQMKRKNVAQHKDISIHARAYM